jgi:hypothetical protein
MYVASIRERRMFTISWSYKWKERNHQDELRVDGNAIVE